jgi:hypothetical protein
MGALPMASRVLPGAIADGLGSTSISFPLLWIWLAGSALAGLLLAVSLRNHAFAAGLTAIAAAFLWFEAVTFPGIDRGASARPLWLKKHPSCASSPRPGMLYGLNYYAGRDLPPCGPDLDQPAATGVR